MVDKDARQWLNEKYPEREQVEEIDNSYGEELLKGNLIIESFPNLKKISLVGNRNIVKVVICGCPLVKEVDVSNNRLNKLEISELTNLEYLHVGNNQLRELDLEQNIRLKSLICFDNPRLRKENIRGLENLTQLKLLECDERLQPIANLKEVYERKVEEVRAEKDEALRNLQNEKTAHQETLAILTSAHETITNAQNELGINNLNNLPLMPEGDTLYTLLQRPTPARLERAREELNIEREHSLDVDRWYRRLVNEELVNEALKFQKESQLKSKLIDELKAENEIVKKVAELEIGEKLELFTKIGDKKDELKEKKVDIKDKLENDAQKIFLKNLLTAQEQLVCLENANRQARLSSEKLLRNAKRSLGSILSEEEINSLCQLQVELTRLEMELEQIKEDRLEARIEERQLPHFEN